MEIVLKKQGRDTDCKGTIESKSPLLPPTVSKSAMEKSPLQGREGEEADLRAGLLSRWKEP